MRNGPLSTPRAVVRVLQYALYRADTVDPSVPYETTSSAGTSCGGRGTQRSAAVAHRAWTRPSWITYEAYRLARLLDELTT